MISIYDDYDELMFSRKFMIYEDIVNVGVKVKRSRDVKMIAVRQSIDMVIAASGLNFNNPLETIKTLVIQNNNLNTAISDLKPQYTLGNELIYRYNTESAFWAGNEYLNFDNKNIRGGNISIQSFDLQDLYHNKLYTNRIVLYL